MKQGSYVELIMAFERQSLPISSQVLRQVQLH